MTVQYWDSFSHARSRVATATLAFAATLVLGLVAIQSVQAKTYKVLFSFNGKDGAFSGASLVRDKAGNLYGTTEFGGLYDNGVVFKVDTDGSESVLYNFTGGADGAAPFGSLLLDSEGNLYGTASGGGSSYNGVVFKVDTGSNESVLYSFAGGTTDGCRPIGGLIRDKVGSLYGTTWSCGASGVGTVFRLSKTGKETVLHSFAGPDGALPWGLLMDKTGKLYGITNEGGGNLNCDRGPSQGCGVVYKLDKSGNLTVLHSFRGGTMDGCYVFGTPAMDTNGNLYGTTQACGVSDEGTVWKVNKRGKETVLHSFMGGVADGALPDSGVILDARGNLYGDTSIGGGTGCTGNFGCGTVYELNKRGTLTLLHRFLGPDGVYPYGGVIRDINGNFYGTTPNGGSYIYGTVWKLTP